MDSEAGPRHAGLEAESFHGAGRGVCVSGPFLMAFHECLPSIEAPPERIELNGDSARLCDCQLFDREEDEEDGWPLDGGH